MNNVSLDGNLTRDVETKVVNGTELSAFGLAVDDPHRGADGELKKNTVFLDCEAWGYTAQDIAGAKKGARVVLGGTLRTESWEAADGTKRSKVKVRVNTIGVVPRNKKADDSADSTTAKTKPTKETVPPSEDEEIPF